MTSTFGNGEPPKMAESMASWLDSKLTKSDVLKIKNLDLSDIPEEEPFEDKSTMNKKNKGANGATFFQRLNFQNSAILQDLK